MRDASPNLFLLMNYWEIHNAFTWPLCLSVSRTEIWTLHSWLAVGRGLCAQRPQFSRRLLCLLVFISFTHFCWMLLLSRTVVLSYEISLVEWGRYFGVYVKGLAAWEVVARNHRFIKLPLKAITRLCTQQCITARLTVWLAARNVSSQHVALLFLIVIDATRASVLSYCTLSVDIQLRRARCWPGTKLKVSLMCGCRVRRNSVQAKLTVSLMCGCRVRINSV